MTKPGMKGGSVRLPSNRPGQGVGRRNRHSMKKPRKGLLIVVSAPSGAGKTTLCREMADAIPYLKYSISYTTRAPRPGERDGKDYIFVSEDEFKKMVGRDEFAEWAEVHNHYYGTHEGFLKRTLATGTDVLLDVDTQGAKLLKKRFPEAVFIFVLPPSLETLKDRLRGRRADSPDEIERRFRVARREIESYGEYQYIIFNENVKEAVRELESIILAERIRIDHCDREWIRKKFLE